MDERFANRTNDLKIGWAIWKLDERFDNFKNIQNVFLNCFFDSSNTQYLFEKLTSNEKTDFSRYNYFFASYLASKGKIGEAKEIIDVYKSILI